MAQPDLPVRRVRQGQMGPMAQSGLLVRREQQARLAQQDLSAGAIHSLFTIMPALPPARPCITIIQTDISVWEYRRLFILWMSTGLSGQQYFTIIITLLSILTPPAQVC